MLAECLKSVLAQEDVDWECVVSDDGSTEDTRSAVPDDPRFRFISGEHSGHLSVVRNRGIREVRGECVAFVDDDDMLTPDSLRYRLEALAGASPMAFVCGTALIVGARMTYDYAAMLVDDLALRKAFTQIKENVEPWFSVHGGSVLVPMAVIERYGVFDEHPAMRFGQDRELWARWCMQGMFPVHCGEPVTFWRGHPQQKIFTRTLEDRDRKNAYRTRILKERAACMTPENTPMLNLARQ